MSEDAVRHPQLEQFARALERGELDVVKANAFDRWRQNPKKCEPGSPLKEAADALWARYEAAGERASSAPRRDVHAGRERRDQRDRRGGGGRSERGRGRDEHAAAAVRGDNDGAAPPSVVGAPFHNPYTFLPFGDPRERRKPPTPLSVDEVEEGRTSGILELTVRTESPLLSCHPKAEAEDASGHKAYRALAIGPDVIVPATGVRGSLRTLMTVLTGGTLGYLDEELWLCQGRDAQLGPAGERTRGQAPDHAFLAEVVVPGDLHHPGRVRVGETRLVEASVLETAYRSGPASGSSRSKKGALPRPEHGESVEYLWVSEDGRRLGPKEGPETPWKVKLSGEPVNKRGKREGLFRADPRPEAELTLPAALWAAYAGRNRHGVHPRLEKGDLVWLEPRSLGTTQVREPGDVVGLQWARWGKHGQRLLDVVRAHHAAVLPDSMNPDGLVDEVADLFGQVPSVEGAAGPFAGRIRPENLVFRDAADAVTKSVRLAPLQAPHPGCAAFYRDRDDPDAIGGAGDGLRGYKVYRTTRARGADAPWLEATQAVYDEAGRPEKP